MTDTEAALLRAIAAHPEEDTPRLVYADWLDEQGEPSRAARAEFVRAQVRAARLPDGDPERKALEGRATALLYLWEVLWQRDMPPGFRTLVYYRRGFAHRAEATASQMGTDDDPRLHLVDSLELWPDVPADRLAEVLRHPLFARLRELVVRGTLMLGSEGGFALAGARFPNLERLAVAGQGIGDGALRALGRSRGFPKLRDLDVSSNGLSDGALEEFRRFAPRVRPARLHDTQ